MKKNPLLRFLMIMGVILLLTAILVLRIRLSYLEEEKKKALEAAEQKRDAVSALEYASTQSREEYLESSLRGEGYHKENEIIFEKPAK